MSHNKPSTANNNKGGPGGQGPGGQGPEASKGDEQGQPSSLTTYGSTVFKFNRSEKKWKEKGSGDVVFSLKLKSRGADIDQLIVSVGKLSFVVQGGVRPKGSKAIVMRGKEIRAQDYPRELQSGDAIILAVRFEQERDSRNLFQMLTNTPWIRPQRGHGGGRRERHSKQHKSKRSAKGGPPWGRPERPPPKWFMAKGTREQECIRALASTSQVSYLEDGTIQRQLATIYKLTGQQIDEAIDFFQPWLKLGGNVGGGSRSFSIGTRTDVSSLPSVHTAKLDYNKPAVTPLQRAVRSPTGQAQLPHWRQDKNAGPPPYYPHDQSDYMREINPHPPDESKDNPPANNTSNAKAGGAARPAGNGGRGDYESNSRQNRPSPAKPGGGRSDPKNLVPLSTQNLLVYTKMLPSSKMDFRGRVTMWLRETHGPNPDDPSDHRRKKSSGNGGGGGGGENSKSAGPK